MKIELQPNVNQQEERHTSDGDRTITIDLKKSPPKSLWQNIRNYKDTGHITMHNKEQELSANSLFIFPLENQVRRALIWFIEWQWFERAIILCVIINSLSLALYDYSDRDDVTLKNYVLTNIGNAITFIFLLEFILKVIAFGLVLTPNSYFRDPWNVLDFIIVIAGLIEFSIKNSNIGFLRCLRTLRPLKTIKTVEQMKGLVQTLLISLFELANVTIFLMFIVLLFAIFGLQQFSDSLYYRCRIEPFPHTEVFYNNGTQVPPNIMFVDPSNMYTQLVWDKNESIPRACSQSAYGGFHCPANNWCGTPLQYGISLQDDGFYDNDYLQYGVCSFENFGQALFGVFIFIAKDGWSDFMYNLMDSNIPEIACIYGCLIVLVGSFCLINLILAVIQQAFYAHSKEELKLKQEKHLEEINQQKALLEEHGYNLKNNPMANDKHEADLDDLIKRLQEGDSHVKIHEVEKAIQRKLMVNFHLKDHSHQPSSGGAMGFLAGVMKAHKHDKNEHPIDTFKGLYAEIAKIKDDKKRHLLQHATKKQHHLMLKAFHLEHKKKKHAENQQKYGVSDEMQMIPMIRNKIAKKVEEIKEKQSKQSSNVMASRESFQKELGEELGFNPNDFFNDEHTKIVTSVQIYHDFKEAYQKQKLYRLLFGKLKKMVFHVCKLEDVIEKAEEQMKKDHIEQRANKHVIYRICSRITHNRYFNMFILTCILINIVYLASDSYPVNSMAATADQMNLFFYSIFLTEVILKMISMGLERYFSCEFDVLDFIIIVISTVDVCLTYTIFNSSSSSNLKAIRTLRMLRILKIGKQFPEFTEFVKTIIKTLKDISYFSFLLLLFLFVYTLLGMEIFAFKYKYNPVTNELDMSSAGQYPVSSFNSFIESFITMFIILCVDGWFDVFMPYYRGFGVVGTLFCVSFIIIGQYILLNLFIAIVIDNFDENSEHHSLVEEANKPEGDGGTKKKTLFHKMKTFSRRHCSCSRARIYQEHGNQLQQLARDEEQSQSKENNENNDIINQAKIAVDIIHNASHEEAGNLNTSAKLTYSLEKKRKKMYLSLNLMSEDNLLRKICIAINESRAFYYIVLFFIILSSAQLAIDNPLNDPNNLTSYVISILDYVVAVAYAIEAIIKIIAQGFLLNGKNSYLRSYSNILDFIITLLQIIYMCLTPLGVQGFVLILSYSKVLRPLRIINKNEGLKVSIQSLFLALPKVGNVIIVTVLYFLIMAIVAITIFKGQFFQCNTDALAQEPSGMVTKWDCLNNGGLWVNYESNFDNIQNAIATLFHCITTVDWEKVMYVAAYGQGIDMTPSRDNAIYYKGLYFVVFIICGTFFILNLFVGVIISTFNREKERIGKDVLLTDHQAKWLQERLIVIRAHPKKYMLKPKNPLRALIFSFVENKIFERFIYVCILLNTVILCIKWYDQPPLVDTVTNYINDVFAIIFITEAILKIICLGDLYFKESWNIFDFIIVIGTTIGLFLGFTTSDKQIGPQTTLIRSFRAGRVFRLFKKQKSLKIMFHTFIATLPSLLNVGSLLFLFFYVYSILGMQLFANIMWTDPLFDNINFTNPGYSFLVLMRSLTGENWNEIQYAVRQEYSLSFQCINNPTYTDYVNNGYQPIGCGNNYWGFLFFTSYILIVVMIFINLFIAVILQGFDVTTKNEHKVLNSDIQEHFRDIWALYDPEGSTFIPVDKLPAFLVELGEPLGWDKSMETDSESRQKIMADMNIQIHHNETTHQDQYQFIDVLEHLSLVYIIRQEIETVLQQEDEKYKLGLQDANNRNSIVATPQLMERIVQEDQIEEKDAMEEQKQARKKKRKQKQPTQLSLLNKVINDAMIKDNLRPLSGSSIQSDDMSLNSSKQMLMNEEEEKQVTEDHFEVKNRLSIIMHLSQESGRSKVTKYNVSNTSSPKQDRQSPIHFEVPSTTDPKGASGPKGLARDSSIDKDINHLFGDKEISPHHSSTIKSVIGKQQQIQFQGSPSKINKLNIPGNEQQQTSELNSPDRVVSYKKQTKHDPLDQLLVDPLFNRNEYDELDLDHIDKMMTLEHNNVHNMNSKAVSFDRTTFDDRDKRRITQDSAILADFKTHSPSNQVRSLDKKDIKQVRK